MFSAFQCTLKYALENFWKEPSLAEIDKIWTFFHILSNEWLLFKFFTQFNFELIVPEVVSKIGDFKINSRSYQNRVPKIVTKNLFKCLNDILRRFWSSLFSFKTQNAHWLKTALEYTFFHAKLSCQFKRFAHRFAKQAVLSLPTKFWKTSKPLISRPITMRIHPGERISVLSW